MLPVWRRINEEKLVKFIEEQFPHTFSKGNNKKGKLFLPDGDPSQNWKILREAMEKVMICFFSRNSDMIFIILIAISRGLFRFTSLVPQQLILICVHFCKSVLGACYKLSFTKCYPKLSLVWKVTKFGAFSWSLYFRIWNKCGYLYSKYLCSV